MTPNQQTLSILFIGGGNMAQAILGGLLSGRASPTAYRLHIVEPDPSCRARLLHHWGGQISLSPDLYGIPGGATSPSASSSEPSAFDWVILAVKPQHAQEALQALQPVVVSNWAKPPALLSIAAGVTLKSLALWSGLRCIVRSMPNTPAMVQQGMTGACSALTLDPLRQAQADLILGSLGQVVWLSNESGIDAVTAMSGSGPAYVFYFLESFAQAGEKIGLSAAQSQLLAAQTLKGALALLEQSAETPGQLRDKVTSKGGTTAAALAVLQASPGMMSLMQEAVAAAFRRAQELGATSQNAAQDPAKVSPPPNGS